MLLSLPLAGPAQSHPVHEVLQAAYLTLSPDGVRLELDLTPGADVAGTVLAALDADGNRNITETEARDYAAKVLGQSTLTVDGQVLGWTLTEVVVPPYANLDGNADTLRIAAFAGHAGDVGAHVVRYENRYYPTASRWMANVFLKSGAGLRYAVTRQQRDGDGRTLTVDFTVSRR